MKDQHIKISGHRDLSQDEIDLMNEIKEVGARLGELQAKVADTIRPAFAGSDCYRWASIARTDLQMGLMALVRAVAQPTTF